MAPGPDSGLFTDESRMFRLRENGIEYNVAVQTAIEPCIPCVGEQQIVLLKPSGEILDRIQCQMTIKLGTGRRTTEPRQEPEPDSARAIVRYVGTARLCQAVARSRPVPRNA